MRPELSVESSHCPELDHDRARTAESWACKDENPDQRKSNRRLPDRSTYLEDSFEIECQPIP